MEISSRTLISLFKPGSVHSGSASWDDCDRVFPESFMWAGLLIGSHTRLDSGIVSPLRLRWVKGVRVCRCKLPSELLAEWPFTCHCGNKGMERTPNESQHTKLTLEKKIFPPILPGFELATFRSRVRHYNQQAIPARCACLSHPTPPFRCTRDFYLRMYIAVLKHVVLNNATCLYSSSLSYAFDIE